MVNRWGSPAVAVVSLLAGPLVATAASAEPARELMAEQAAPLVQRIEPQVVLRPLGDGSVSAKGNDLSQISAVGSYDVPEAALRAYRHAARTLARTASSCEMPWTLLAGVGRVESDHGRYGGSQLDSEGVSHPAIRGVALNGVGPVAAIPDSDGGRFDGDSVWDRAVGPMQFIPDTWRWAGRDGDGDGVTTPNDLDDAALAAGAYLCPASGSVLPESSMRTAIFAYNHSDYYVDLVMAFEQGYRTGTFVIPSPPPPPEPEEPEKDHKADRTKKRKPVKPVNPVKPVKEPKPKPAKDPKPKPTKPKPTKPKPTKPTDSPVEPPTDEVAPTGPVDPGTGVSG